MTLATVARGKLLIILSSNNQSGLTEAGNKSEFLSFLLVPEVVEDSDPSSVSGVFLFFVELDAFPPVFVSVAVLVCFF